MSRHYSLKTDDNHEAIVRALRSIGASVQSLVRVGEGAPDLLVGYRRQAFLLEVKNPGQVPSKQRLTALEASWHSTWRGPPVSVVHDADEALRAVGARTGPEADP